MSNSQQPQPLTDRQAYLSALVKNLPNLPGVYKMHDKAGAILYVGKAKSLKNRVASYFAKQHSHPKTSALVARIVDIETIVVHNETEALLLEQTLIKEHRPPYNIILRDDKSYVYICFSNDPFPKISLKRGKEYKNSQHHFGPYPSSHTAKQAMLFIQQLFGLRVCSNSEFASTKRPCLEYQIKRCLAPCVALVTHDEYQDSVKSALLFLKGQTDDIKNQLIDKMQACADDLQFEQAAAYRDKLAMIHDIVSRQFVYQAQGQADVMAIDAKAGVMCVHVLTVRNGQVLGGKNYFIDDVAYGHTADGLLADGLAVKNLTTENLVADSLSVDNLLADSLSRFVMSFYQQVGDDVPNTIIVNQVLSDEQAIGQVLQTLTGQTTHIQSRVRGNKKQWLELAQLNANHALNAKLANYHELQSRFESLKKALQPISTRPIEYIECFDVSHTMGESAIASCVVCDSGGLRKKDYRQYAIYGITQGDDYGAMRQALIRRYSKTALPDVLLIDGGVGQLNVANQVLMALGKSKDTLLIGIAKGENRKAGLEVLHFVDYPSLDLPEDSKALHLLMYIRDEAHRFALSCHQKKRDKARGSSVLEVITGLGAKRRRDLLTHFGGMGQLLSASKSEIAQVKGIGKVLADTIYKALHE